MTALPAGWRRVPIRDAVRDAQVGFACGERDPDGVIQLRMNSVTRRGRFDWESLLRVPTEPAVVARYRLEPGDVLFNNTNSVELVGKSALFDGYAEPVVFSNHFTRLRTIPEACDPQYLQFALLHLWQQGVFATICNRWVGQAAVQRDKLLTLDIPLPPLTEQRRIVARLGEALAAVERARAAARVQVELAERLVPTEVTRVFAEEVAGFRMQPLGSFAETTSGATPPRGQAGYFGGAIPWVKTGELRDGVICDTEEHVSEAGVRASRLKVLPPGTLLVAMYGQGQTRGRTGRLAMPATTNQACFAVLPNPAAFDPRFLQWWFRNNYRRLREASEGRGGNQPNLNGRLLKEQLVPLPPVAAQAAIADRLDAAEQKALALTAALNASTGYIESLPISLLDQAFAGDF